MYYRLATFIHLLTMQVGVSLPGDHTHNNAVQPITEKQILLQVENREWSRDWATVTVMIIIIIM